MDWKKNLVFVKLVTKVDVKVKKSKSIPHENQALTKAKKAQKVANLGWFIVVWSLVFYNFFFLIFNFSKKKSTSKSGGAKKKKKKWFLPPNIVFDNFEIESKLK